VPLGNEQLALLDAPPGGTSSVHGQVVRFDGTNFTQLSSTNLPATTARNTRANVWLFETEPFVNRQAGFVASFNTPDWSDGVSGLPTALNVIVQDDSGTSAGLGTLGTNILGAPPSGSAYGLPNQYNAAISLFSYATPRAAQPVTVTISPAPGTYDGPISISFSTLNASDKVFYRVGAEDPWRNYAAAFQLTNDNTIEYYGTNAAYKTRSQLQTAAYTLGIPAGPTPTVNLNTGGSTTNPPPVFVGPTNVVVLSPVGTIFYGRRSTANAGTVWAINYDGSDDTYVTTGVRPRVSRDGQWLAVMRGAGAFSSAGNIWLHNIQSGAEYEVFNNTGRVVCYDWAPDNSGLILDYNCGIYMLDTNGVFTELLATDCYKESPVFNPVTGQIAFDDITAQGSAPGIYVGAPGASNVEQIVSSIRGASWPEWSPDGKDLSFVDDNTYASLDMGTNLWVVAPDGSSLNQICDFTGTSNRFPHGALWSPDSSALAGAADIYGTNGLWIIPLNSDRTDCTGGPILLPTTPGDAIDFAGSIVVAPPASNAPSLFLESGTNSMVVVWSTNFANYTLEYTLNFSRPIVWHAIPGPYTPAGLNYQYAEAFDKGVPEKIFRLAPNVPQVFIGVGMNSMIIYWPTNYAQFTLEYSTTLTGKMIWQPILGPYDLNGAYFEYSEPLGRTGPAKFFRILGP
jgi:Tol biopolymer transport system component